MSTGAEATRRNILMDELERVRQYCRMEPSIRQILVFGSYATGDVHEWSDLDLVIIQDTEAPFLDRSMSLVLAIRPKAGIQFLVYTPKEARELIQRPFFRHEILTKGKVLPMHPHEEAARWLEYAEEDLQMAELAYSEKIYNQVCFHAQQAVEKCLKAAIAANGDLVPRSHMMADLIREVPEELQSKMGSAQDQLFLLDQLYIPTRYPDAVPGSLEEGLPDEDQAETARKTARNCCQVVRDWIQVRKSESDSESGT